MLKKAYLIGFGKGVFICLVFSLVFSLCTYNQSIRGLDDTLPSYFTALLFYLLGLFIISFLIYKNKQPRGWMGLAFMTAIYSLPFLLGSIELEKSNYHTAVLPEKDDPSSF